MSSNAMEIAAVPEEAYFIQPALRPENGCLAIPRGPGLGIELDEEVIARYRVT
jgi:L-alanine-DL-glutamate epimerase-like enolase superfamily enzyme